MKLFCAIDIGGTNTRIAIYNQDEIQQDYLKIATNVNHPEVHFKNICQFLNKFQLSRIAIDVPGPTDYQKGIILDPPNLPGWHNFSFLTFLKKYNHCQKILVSRDVQLMAYANHVDFQLTKKNCSVFFTVSTGLGSCAIINNSPFTGTNGQAGEVYNMPVLNNDIDSCNYLSPGAAEYYTGGNGLLKQIQSIKPEVTSPKWLFENYLKNKDARKIIDKGIVALANTIAAHVAILNPKMLIFGGSIAHFNHWYIKKAIEKAKKHIIATQLAVVQFKISRLGDDAALLGGLKLAKKEFIINWN